MKSVLYEQGIEIIGVCKMPKNLSDAIDCYTLHAASKPIVIIDCNWSNVECGFSCTAACEALLIYDNSINLILVSTFFESKLVQKAVQLKAKGYIYRNLNSVYPIIDCIKAVAEGKCYYVDPLQL